MKAFFGFITSMALRFWYLTVLLIAVVLVLGTVAVTQLNQELLPPVEFPQTIILAQVSGMTSEEVLTVLTERLEERLQQIGEIVNLESTTTGSFGAVLIARNEFGIDAEKLRANIQTALDEVWLPLRRIQPEAGQDANEFAVSLLGDVQPELMIYLAQKDPNFLFQLSPDVWAALPDDTVKQTLAYLATQVEQTDDEKSELAHLVEQQIVPQLNAIDLVANVSISGGQALPGEENFAAPVETGREAESLLLQLSPKIWSVVAPKAGLNATLDEEAVTALREVTFTVPENAPELPQSWQGDHYFDATDLTESTTLTTTLAGVFNNFYESGRIVSALGQTNDLTPETVTQLLEIAPSLVNYLEAEQLVSLSPEVFAVLPEDYIAGLDGFTRDALAAKALAQSITGEEGNVTPVPLPSAWRIRPPQLITFSFADIPLATFSISTLNSPVATENQTENIPTDEGTETPTEPQSPSQQTVEVPEGPALPPGFGILGGFIGLELNTADDLINIQLPENMAQQFGSSSLRAADLLNFLLLLNNPDALPAGVEMPRLPFNTTTLISSLSPEVVAFLAENDPTFIPNLSEDVFNALSDEVLAQPQIAPPLADVWSALAEQPQFADQPLHNTADLMAIGNGSASTVLNTINTAVPGQFAGYEVRLFDSLSPAAMRYFTLNEPGFYSALDTAVLAKMSPQVLALLPEETLSALPENVAADLRAIASGEKASAYTDLSALYTTDAPPADPNAPALNADWAFIGDFIGVELDTADDFFRFFPDPANFLNSFFDSAQGVNFAPNLFGNLTPEMLTYMLGREPRIADELRIEALQLLKPETLAVMPQSTQERAVAGGEPFVPTERVTRLNGASSLQVTVFKTRESNTVEAFHRVDDVIKEIQAQNPDLLVNVAFEQASFIEESISGVAREGSLGALFAMIVILVFLSGGHWHGGSRRITGVVMIILFSALLAWYISSQAPAYTGDFGAWLGAMGEGVVFFVLLAAGIVIGLIIAVSPNNVLPYPAWRATLVIGVSIPLSVLAAMIGMHWLSPAIHNLLEPLAETSSFFKFVIRLFPETLTLNIMTLSGLTVAIGRVVDDSIVVLENIFRQMQNGVKKREAIISGTRDVSQAIFVATVVTVVVFLPLGLTGGLIGEFFLPFGLAVTYSLAASFVVAVTVVPLLTLIFIREEDELEEEQTVLERTYIPILNWALSSNGAKLAVFVMSIVSAGIGFALFGGRPAAFLPDFGDPQIGVNVNMPPGTKIVQTNELVAQFEERVREIVPAEQLGAVQTIVGGGGMSIESLFTGGGVSENVASITIGIEASEAELNAVTAELRAAAAELFGEENTVVSAASLSEQGFGGFALVLSGPQEDIAKVNDKVVETIGTIPGITNVASNLTVTSDENQDTPQTYIRIDGETAIRYTAELETQNTIGVTQQALEAIKALPEIPSTVKVSQGFESETQVQGFASLFTAMIIAVVIMVVILVFTFGSPVYWLAIIFSIVVAPVGAAVALTLTDRVLGISALIGLLMLLGIVVTNAVVLIDRAHTNDVKKRMPLKEALTEAGERRLRPIIMTALATIGALMPLAIGLSKGAIIASELGTVVIGGLFSSTLLTLIVVPVAYSFFHPIHNAIMGLFRRSPVESNPQASSAD